MRVGDAVFGIVSVDIHRVEFWFKTRLGEIDVIVLGGTREGVVGLLLLVGGGLRTVVGIVFRITFPAVDTNVSGTFVGFVSRLACLASGTNGVGTILRVMEFCIAKGFGTSRAPKLLG